MIVDVSGSADRVQESLLEIPDHVLEESRGGGRQAELRLMLSKRNAIGVTAPIVRPYEDAIDATTRDRVGFALEQSDLVAVLMTVDCRPDPDCRFNWLRVEVTLGTDDPRPVACRLYPERAEDQVKRVRSVEFGGEMAISVMGVTGPAVKGARTNSMEADELQYRVMTFGRFGSTPAWHFARTAVAPEVIGDILLVLVVAVPAGSEAVASAVVSAEVQLKSVPFAVPMLTRRTGDGLLLDGFSLRAGQV